MTIDKISEVTLVEQFCGALATLLHEVLDGPANSGAFVLNRGDVGILGSLARLSAKWASARVDGGASVAAHVDHLRYGLGLLNRWARGEDPWSTANYTTSWQRNEVNEEEWTALREALQVEARAWEASVVRRADWNQLGMTEAIASAVHLAYHLGAIRQITAAARGPRAHA